MYTEKVNLRKQGTDGTICGWGSVPKSDQKNISIENAEYSENLHCMVLCLKGNMYCKEIIRSGDYKKELLCGEAILPEIRMTSVSTI